jgi:hypothetical protein
MSDKWDNPIPSARTNLPKSTFGTGLGKLRNSLPPGVPQGYKEPSETWWQDILAFCNGDEAQAAACMLEELGRLAGYATFYLGETAVNRINDALRRHESKLKLRLVLG